jgi:hypothetical protein
MKNLFVKTIIVLLALSTFVFAQDSSPAASPSPTPVATPAANIITRQQLAELPSLNRSFLPFLEIVPGVSSNLADQIYFGTNNPSGQSNTVNISVNGARSSQNTFTVDGADITDRGSNLTIQTYPGLDTISEIRISRTIFAAESGRSGGGQINIVTRSGAAKFHGSLFEFVRNEKFNANTFFNNQTAPFGIDSNGKALREPFRYNNFGFTVSGPVYFLKFGEREPNDNYFGKIPKTYFFFSEEQRRDVRYRTLSSTVPDANLRQGIFPIDICLSGVIAGVSRTCTNVLPAGTPFSTRAVINPVSLAYLNIYRQLPLPNGNNFGLISPVRNESKFRQEVFRIDTAITKDLSVFYKFQNDSIPTVEPNALFSSGSGLPNVSATKTNSPGRAQTLQVNYSVNPKLSIESRLTRIYGAILSENIGLLATSNTTVPVSLAYSNQRDRIPTLTGNGFSGFSGFGQYDNFSTKDDVGANLTYLFGNHTIKFGGNFSKYRKNENALVGNNEGAFSNFLNTTSASPTQGVVCASGSCTTTTQINLQNFANFLLGTNATFTQAKTDYTVDLRQRNFEAFAQDEFRIRKNLTLYFGVRYSFFGSPWDKNGLLTNFVPELYNASQAPLVTGAGNRVANSGNFCSGLIVNSQNYQTAPNCTPTISPFGKYVVEAPKTNFAPRIGLAWSPFDNGKTVIRAGYGIFHDQTLVGIFAQNVGTNPPYQETTTLNQIALNQVFAVNPTVNLGTISVRGEDTNWQTPYVQHWSLNVEQRLGKNTFFTVGYFGSKGTNLIGIIDINLLRPGYALTQLCATGASTNPTVACQMPGAAFTSATQENILDQIRPFRGYKAINMIKPIFSSNYHSLQISGQQRLSEASQINIAYTWSKNLTDNPTDRATAPQNPYDIRSEYGRAQLDRRHIFVANYIYELPFFSGQKGLAGFLLGGWQSAGIFTYQTGLPLTATISNYDPAGIGFLGNSVSSPRPNQIGNPNSGATGTQQQFFNTAAFQTVFPATGISNTVGNAVRGSIFGPRTVRFDFALMKNLNFTESMKLQLRFEAFNVFNTVNFTTVNTNASQFNLGTVTGTKDPRTIQLGAKFYF